MSMKLLFFIVLQQLLLQLQYLSYKYEYPELKQITDKLVIKYSKELLFNKFLFIENKKENTNIENENLIKFFDTSKEEEYILKYMNDFIQRDEKPKLKVSILKRILDKYYQIESNDEKVKNEDMNDFLFKCLDQHGIKASILLNKVDFGEEQIKLIHRLFHDHQDKFDFSFLNSTLAKATFRMINDMNKQKEEYSNLFFWNEKRNWIERRGNKNNERRRK